VAIPYNNSAIAGKAKQSHEKKLIFSYEIAALPLVARNDIIKSPFDKIKLLYWS